MNAARWSTSVPSVGSIGRKIRTRIAPWTSRRRRLSSKWSARRAGWWTRWTRLHSFQRLLGPGRGRLASRSNLSRWPKSGRHDSWPWMHGCAFATLSRFWTRAWTATSMSEKSSGCDESTRNVWPKEKKVLVSPCRRRRRVSSWRPTCRRLTSTGKRRSSSRSMAGKDVR